MLTDSHVAAEPKRSKIVPLLLGVIALASIAALGLSLYNTLTFDDRVQTYVQDHPTKFERPIKTYLEQYPQEIEDAVALYAPDGCTAEDIGDWASGFYVEVDYSARAKSYDAYLDTGGAPYC